MSDSPSDQEPSEEPAAAPDGDSAVVDGGFRGFVDRVTSWIRDNLVEALITAAIAFAVGWFVNVYVVAVRYEGTVAGTGGTATVAGNWITGSLFWVILAAILTTLISYGRRVGPQRLIAELVVLPRNLVRGFTKGNEGWSLMLFAAAVSLVVAVVFGAAAAGISGLALLLIAASPLVRVLGRGIRGLGVRAVALAAGDDANRLASASSMTSVLGAALGMVVAWQVPGVAAKLVTAAVALLASVLVLRGTGPAQTTATVVLGALAAVALKDLLDGVALADDGGWREGGGNLGSWISSPGATTVMTNSTVAGGMAGVGGVTGAATGQVLASTVTDASMGGLSGEWGAQDAGVDPIPPGSPPPGGDTAGGAVVPPPDTGPAPGQPEPQQPSPDQPASEQPSPDQSAQEQPPQPEASEQPSPERPSEQASPEGAGGPDSGSGAGDSGGDPAGGSDASLGGLSGEWSGQGPPPQSPPTQPGDGSGGGGPAVPPPTDDGPEKR